ncbi:MULTISPECIES: ESX secretion-associated protein EspG [Nocardia]|uniref:ESX secretion-associated protein EspG n=1 Tax=Nocardia abscessus TaxID=120957 RepID=UPI002B4B4A66|nr:ESX secretion-associated protein EspG [Nocardia abscessus]
MPPSGRPGTPNTPGAVPAAARSGNPSGRPGMGGMPGGMAPGSRGGKSDDESSKGIPDYLITQEHGNELTGLDDLPRTVPPVIGDNTAPVRKFPMPEVRSWRFTALEFRTLWESTGRDVLPYPLRHQYTTEFRPESLRLRQEAARSLHPCLDDDLLRAVEVLLAPEARVELAGFAGARRDRKLRAHAGVHYQHGAVAVQEPGPGHEPGDVVLTLLPAAEVARTVVDVFPRCGAGRGKQVQATAEELTRPRPPARDAWRPTPREQFEQFFS